MRENDDLAYTPWGYPTDLKKSTLSREIRMQLNLVIESRSRSSLQASYSCPCGCRPQVTYQRGSTPATDDCCCGNAFAVGSGAEGHTPARAGFDSRVEMFDAPWGEALPAVWAIGPSVHADEVKHAAEHEHNHDEHTEHRGHAPDDRTPDAIDPVCGMTVDPAAARANGLQSTYQGRELFFCGKGCKLEFDDDPERYLDPAHVPSM